MHTRMNRLGLAGMRADSTGECEKELLNANLRLRSGKAKVGILLWLIGIPIPLILLFLLIRSCV